MADNIAITAGSGTTVRTDDVGGIQVQMVKIDVGGDGTSTMMDSTHPVYVSNATQAYTSDPLGTAGLDRTADTNAYGAGDVLGHATGSTAAITFTSIGPGAGEIMITSSQFYRYAAALISGETTYTLHLYNVTPPSAYGDNVAWDLAPGDRPSYLGFINLGQPVDIGSTLYVEQNNINKQITLASSSVFGYLVTVGAYTPVSGAVHRVILHAVAV